MPETKVNVELPDGARAGAREWRHRRRRRRGDRPGPGQGRARDQGRRRAARPQRPALGRRADRDRHRQEPRGPGPGPPRRRPRAGRGGAGPVAGREDLDRAPDRRRLLLRHRLPGRREPGPGRPRPDRGADARAHRRRRAIRAARAVRGRGDRALPWPGPGLQGRADRGPGPRRGGRDRDAVPQRPLRGPLPRPARPLDRAHRRLQADLARRRLLARRRDPADADPHLRHRVPRSEAARRAPRAARAGAASGTTASWAPSWTCSCCGRRRPGCPSGSRTAAPCWS